jgi:hypothetical protein
VPKLKFLFFNGIMFAAEETKLQKVWDVVSFAFEKELFILVN